MLITEKAADEKKKTPGGNKNIFEVLCIAEGNLIC